MVELTEYRLQIALDVLEQMRYQEAPAGCSESEYANDLWNAKELVGKKLKDTQQEGDV